MSRLYDVDKGEVAVGGVGVAAYALDELRGSVVGVLQQEPFVFSGSLLENVACGGDCDAARASAALRSAGLGGLLEKVGGVGAPVGESGVALSGGERQRLALARALLRPTPVLLVDEFTSGLDEATEREVIRNLLPHLEGRTVIAIAHDPRVHALLGVTRVIAL